VILLCFITFRSWRAVVVAVVPLMLTSILCEALMVALGIGVKVATLAGHRARRRHRRRLRALPAVRSARAAARRCSAERGLQEAVQFTGKVVALVGITLAAGVITWAFSPIKFQADMGILLTFMFVWNMIGALVLIPALSHFLLPTAVAASGARGTGIRCSPEAKAHHSRNLQ
jgi:predicted RND superfamily exporter protein